MNNIKCLICHYKTYEITKRAIESIREFYPSIQITIIDGSGFDVSSAWLYGFAKKDGNTSIYAHNFNIHHGPGMHLGIIGSETGHIFIMDSDAYMIKGGIIEEMEKTLEGRPFHSIGSYGHVDKNGFGEQHSPNPKNVIYPYIHPFCTIINRNVYQRFHPFIKHGAPCVKTSMDIYDKGRTDLLIGFDKCLEYVKHDWRGTRDSYGIQL